MILNSHLFKLKIQKEVNRIKEISESENSFWSMFNFFSDPVKEKQDLMESVTNNVKKFERIKNSYNSFDFGKKDYNMEKSFDFSAQYEEINSVLNELPEKDLKSLLKLGTQSFKKGEVFVFQNDKIKVLDSVRYSDIDFDARIEKENENKYKYTSIREINKEYDDLSASNPYIYTGNDSYGFNNSKISTINSFAAEDEKKLKESFAGPSLRKIHQLLTPVEQQKAVKGRFKQPKVDDKMFGGGFKLGNLSNNKNNKFGQDQYSYKPKGIFNKKHNRGNNRV